MIIARGADLRVGRWGGGQCEQVSVSQLGGGGSGSMLPRENVNFKSSEIARNGSRIVLALVVRWGPWGYVVVQLWIS